MHPFSTFPLRGVIVQRLVKGLRAFGHQVEVFPLGERGGPWRYLRAWPRVADTITTLRPDIIHVIFGYSGLAVPPSRVPMVTTFNGDDLNGTVGEHSRVTWKSRLGIVVSQWVAWRSTRCITVSEGLRDRLWFPWVRTKTAVIRDAVDTTLFRPLPRAAARERLAISCDEVLVIFPHDVTQPNKRLWLAEASVEELRQWIPRARLWVVTGRPADDLPWYYAAADAMLVTSVREGGPSSVKEALACGVPVVSVPVGDTALFGEAPQGMCRAAERPGALAAALRDVLQHRQAERRSQLPAGLSLEEGVEAITELYREAILRRGQGRATAG